VQFYEPPRLAQRLLGGGHHIKIQVSDAGEAIYSSGNITQSSFEAWNEYAVALRGPVVCTLLESVEALGVRVQPVHLKQIRHTSASEIADIELEYWFCNPNTRQGWLGPLIWHGRNRVTDEIIANLDAAKKSISISSFYFKPTRALMKAVLRAARRGVCVEVFHSHRDALPSTDLAWIAAAAGFGRLLRAGITIYENLHGEHSKLVLIDEDWVAFGSYNFEDAAHDRLAEAMLVSRDPRAVKPVIDIFAELRSHKDNLRVPRHWFRQLSLPERTRILRYARFKWWM
jgi:cardiolipin synthase